MKLRVDKRDYYELLGLEKSASPEEIKKSYRKLAMQYHPDRNPGDKSAEEKFKEIGEAYSVLSDDNKKAKYDRYGHAGVQGASGGGGGGGYGAGGFDFSQGFDPFDLFRSVFGGQGGDDPFGGGGRGRPRRARGMDINITLELTLEEIAEGVTKTVKIRYNKPCESCTGTGSSTGKLDRCTACNGSGEVRQVTDSFFGRMMNITACNVCGGTGQRVTSPCSKCNGSGLVRDEKTIKVRVPPGVTGVQFMKLRGDGNAAPRGGDNGDIIVTFKEIPHEMFTRHNDDVHIEREVYYHQAVLGDEVEVPTLDGKVRLKIPAGTIPGKVFKLKGKGIKHTEADGRGDQLVHITVHIPKKLSAKHRKLLEDLALEYETDPKETEGLFHKFKDWFN